MNHRIPPIEQKNTPNIDELKENFRKHDFTAKVSAYEPNFKTEQEKTTYGLALNIFRQIWFAQQKAMGGSASAKNFSADDPIFMLERTDEKFVASATSAIMTNAEIVEHVINTFSEVFKDKIECITELYAIILGKTRKCLDENEEVQAFQIFVNMFVDGNVKLLMQAQSIPEIISVVDEHRTHEDFKPHTVANYDRINFERKWYHTRTKIGSPLSLEVLAEGENAEVPLVTADVAETELKTLIKEFLLTRDKIDRKIYRMREKGMTHKDIADALGYKTHSAVTKRLEKMKNELKLYLTEHRT